MSHDPAAQNVLTDIIKSLNIKLPYKISGNRATIKINDNILLTLSIDLRDKEPRELDILVYKIFISYKIKTIQTGSILEEDQIEIRGYIAINEGLRMWINWHKDKEYGDIGFTDLTDIIPNTLTELSEIIEFYSK